MDETERQEPTEHPSAESLLCPDCGQTYKTPQGLAGHRRLAHSTSTTRSLDERNQELEARRQALEQRAAELARTEEASRRREAEITRRKREIAQTGPSSIGLSQCEDCGAWFESVDNLSAHENQVHPLDEKVATEVGASKEKVNDVWTEACRKQERHPDETPEQIVNRFWSDTDQRILRALLAHNASFKFEEE
jgi:uncharacterized C2H2 Zn-finger protein